MMMNSSGRSSSSTLRFPAFTATQWQELEHQALVFKYMVSGIPVPQDLLFTIRRSLESSLSSSFLLHSHSTIGWNNPFQMGFGRKIDPEPGRCRRTDGKKWRCSKEAYPDSKYCERHMHRGRNRSRKPVENQTTTTTAILSPPSASSTTATTSPPTAVHISSKHTPSSHSHLLYPHLSNPSNPFSSQENPITNFFLDSNPTYSHALKDPRDSYGHDIKRESEGGQLHAYFSESNSNLGTNNNSRTTKVQDHVHDSSSVWPLTMVSSSLNKQHRLDVDTNTSCASVFHSLKLNDHRHLHFNNITTSSDNNLVGHVALGLDQSQPKKIMHRFLDEGPPKDSNNDIKHISSSYSEDKISSQYRTATQLSISTPNSLHDFFMTQKWYSLFLYLLCHRK